MNRYENDLREALWAAAETTDTSRATIDRLITNAEHGEQRVVPLVRPRRWIAPILAAAAVIALAVGISIAVAGTPSSQRAPVGVSPSSGSPSPSAPTPTAATSSAPTSTAPTRVPGSTAPRRAPGSSSVHAPVVPPDPTRASSPAGLAPTVQTTVRPVTASGVPAAGWTVHDVAGAPVDCQNDSASLAAVDNGIVDCTPHSAGVTTCWKAATPGYVLCLGAVFAHQLEKVAITGSFTAQPAVAQAHPLALVLDDGVQCKLRIGGAGIGATGHPNWGVYYYCGDDMAVWADATGPWQGIDQSSASWTVEVGAASGTSAFTKHHVTSAVFVGTDTK